MKHHVLQRMVVSPRQSSSDPRIAQTMSTHRSVGNDGMLYTSVDERDYGKYKVMTDKELEFDARRSQEIREAMNSTNSKSSDSRQARPYSASSSGITFHAPMTGKSNISRQREKTMSNTNENKSIGYDGNEFANTNTMNKSFNSGPEASRDFSERNDRQRDGTRSSKEMQSMNGDQIRRSYDSEDGRGLGPGILGAPRGQSPAPRIKVPVPSAEFTESIDRERQKTPISSVMSALKQKYEQNLDVIEKLFDEKKSMEKLVQSLDSQLSVAKKVLSSPRYAAGAPSSVYNSTDGHIENTESFLRGSYLEDDDRGGRREYDEDFRSGTRPMDSTKPTQIRGSSLPPRGSDGRKEYTGRSSRGAADSFFGDDMGCSREGGDTRSMMSSQASPSPRGEGGSRPPWSSSTRSLDASAWPPSPTPSSGALRASSPTFSKSDPYSHRGRDRGCEESDGPRSSRSRSRSYSTGLESSRRSRSRSFSRSYSTEPVISAHLQADQDRYVQRRRAIEDREREELVDQRRFEEGLRDRSIRASKSGGEFTEMIKRDALARKSIEKKLEAKKVKEEEKEREEAEERRRLKQQQLDRSRHADDLSWAEMTELQSKLREERVARRIIEMSNNKGFEPSKGSEGVARQAARARMNAEPAPPPPVQDPDVVLARLEKQRKDWDEKLERLREQDRSAREKTAKDIRGKAGEQLGVTSSMGDKLFHGTAKMVQRAIEAEAKKTTRYDDKQKQASEEKERKMDDERRRRDKLLNAKVPEEGRRLTKIAEVRADMVRKSLAAKEREREKEEVKMRKKMAAEKQHGEVMRTILSERDKDRKANFQGEFVELNKSQAEVDAIAADNRERFRAKLRENKQKIDRAAEDSPSLLIRHDQAVARSQAASNALNKVAQAVMGGDPGTRPKGGRTSRSLISDDDIFDENQKIILGYQDDFADDD